MKREKNFGCKVHRRVFFSKREAEKHVKKKCHPENIVKLKSKDFLGRMSYNIISEAIENLSLSEKEKEGYRQMYLR